MTQFQKRARFAKITTNIHQEITNQNQFTEDEHLIFIESNIDSVKDYFINKNFRLFVMCIQSLTHLSLNSFTDDVYNLTIQDAEIVAKFDQI